MDISAPASFVTMTAHTCVQIKLTKGILHLFCGPAAASDLPQSFFVFRNNSVDTVRAISYKQPPVTSCEDGMELAQAVIALTRSRSHCPVECDSSRYRHAADPPAGAASFADHTHASRHPFGSTDPTFIPDSLTTFRLILLPMDSRRGLSSLCREDSLTWVDSSQGGIVPANAIAFLLGHHLNSGGVELWHINAESLRRGKT